MKIAEKACIFGGKIDKYSDVHRMKKHTPYSSFNFNTKVNA